MNLANAIVTIKMMPESPEVDLKGVEEKALALIKEFNDESQTRVSIEPVAFGLKSVNITFVMDESLGSPDVLEEKLAAIQGVNSAEVTDVRRAVG